MTYIGFATTLVVAVFSLFLSYKIIVDFQDICLIYLQLCIINCLLCKAMYGHLRNVITKRRDGIGVKLE